MFEIGQEVVEIKRGLVGIVGIVTALTIGLHVIQRGGTGRLNGSNAAFNLFHCRVNYGFKERLVLPLKPATPWQSCVRWSWWCLVAWWQDCCDLMLQVG